MPAVPVRIAGQVEINVADLPPMALESIQAALTFSNEERDKAEQERLFGWWDIPKTVALWKIERRRGGDEVLCLPRGFINGLASGFAAQGYSIELDDQRTSAPASEGYYKPFVLRDYQMEAAVDLLRWQQGFYKCPAGGGKTVTALGLSAWLNQRTLVIVDKAGLLEQWRVRAHQFYGFPLIEHVDEDGNVHYEAPLEGARCAGKIGQGVWEERAFTVCLRQTLDERDWSMDATYWWYKWGVVWFDEGHHLAADTLGALSRKLPCKFMFGISATPSKSPTKGAIVHSLVGPVVHETTRKELVAKGILVPMKVERIETGFQAEFWPTHESTTEGNEVTCLVPGCKKSGSGSGARRHDHRNNYSSVLKKLVEDRHRNMMVAQRMVLDRGHIHLVHSRQLKHLDLIEAALIEAGWPEESIWKLRGEENAKGLSQKIAQAIEKAHEGVVLSTVADEALDIPPIDRVHLPFPGKDEGALIQVAGRGERNWPGKTESILIDYRDDVDVFRNQAAERERVYRMHEYEDVTPMIGVAMPHHEQIQSALEPERVPDAPKVLIG